VLILSSIEQAVIEKCLGLIEASNPEIEWCAILAGSVARGVATDRSDIDLLVISDAGLRRPSCSMRVHVQAFTVDDFRRRLLDGDDFASWCVRLGIPLRDSGTWQTIVSSPEAGQWPDWRKKIPHAARRLILAADLMRAGDVTAAAEESLYAAAHVARAILLRSGIFPFSRPELVNQLSEVDHQMLAELLGRLLASEEDPRFLNRTIRYLKRLLVDLDKKTFGEFASQQARDTADRVRARDVNATNSAQ
jgi:hypothetical protein